ncbi:MAG: branched-chain amino acid ABC transporter permease [Ruminococcaceae bacterium]|nr:branched-chain amino acid ABC transporter permease [Oscillospiraceae bacterium]
MSKPWTKTRKRAISSLITLGFLVVVLLVMNVLIQLGLVNAGVVDMLKFIGINIIAAVSLNMVSGMMGQLVLGHAGFMLVGAYAAAMFTNAVGWPLTASLTPALIIGGLLAAIIGFLIGIPALRLRGDYLAIITLGFGEIIRVIANSLTITNGAKGYYGFPTFSTRQDPATLFNFIFVIAAFVVFFSYTFGTSRHGRAVIAIREDEIAAESSGIRTTYYKLLTFTLSAFFAGVAGGLLAHQLGIIDPSNYGFSKSVEILMMVVLGGMGSITGSVVSASVLTFLPEVLRGFANYRMLIYSVLLICVMLFRPKGLFGRAELRVIKPYEWLRDRHRAKKAQKTGGGGS